MENLMGQDGRLFAEQQPVAGPVTFQVDNTSEQYFNSPYYLQHKDQIQPVPPPTRTPPRMTLAEVLGDDFVSQIQAAQQISFHSVGDTGAAVQAHLFEEEGVADMQAVIVAVHHPPLSADAKHGGTTGLSADIDTASKNAGLWPDAMLSGHAHLYQRFTRTTDSGQQIPYVVAGSGGYNAKASTLGTIPQAPFTQGDVTLNINPIIDYGYLTVTVNMTSNAKRLNIAFNSPKLGKNRDQVTVDLGTRKIVQ
jgi:2',3'-cyclic-nucleotide 2'-phosphodiesterase (5'-nucleotidase family)